MPKYVVARVEDIPPGSRKIVEVERRSIGVFNVDGEFFALRNTCPHAGAELCTGRVSGLRVSESPGSYDYLREGRILRCPWHGWEFDLATGRSWFDPERTRVASYRTEVVEPLLDPDDRDPDDRDPDDRDPDDRDLTDAGLAAGPYRAETYPVRVEQASIVVEL